jgi:hypothetical protein
MLYAAHSARYGSGCSTAAPKFDEVLTKYSGTDVANEATWQAADCYRSLGDLSRARRHYESLKSVPGYSDRATQALAKLDSTPTAVATRRASAPTPAKAKNATKPAAKPAPAKPPEEQSSDALELPEPGF